MFEKLQEITRSHMTLWLTDNKVETVTSVMSQANPALHAAATAQAILVTCGFSAANEFVQMIHNLIESGFASTKSSTAGTKVD